MTAIVLGTVSTLVLLYCGPTIQVDILKHDLAEVSKQWWYFPLKNPCLITMTLSFLSGIVVSLLKPEPAAEAGFAEVERRAILGASPTSDRRQSRLLRRSNRGVRVRCPGRSARAAAFSGQPRREFAVLPSQGRCFGSIIL